MSCFDDQVMLYHILARFNLQFINFSPSLYQLHDKRDTKIQRWINLRITKRWVFFPSLHIYENLPRITAFKKLHVQIHQWFLCRWKSKNVHKSQFDWQATYWFSYLICCVSVSSYILTSFADKTFFSSPKITSNLSLLNFKCAARISTPRGTPIHKRARVRAGNFENDPCKIIKGTWVLSVWEWQQMMFTPKKYQFIKKKRKNPKNKNSFIDMLQRLKSDH